MLAVDQVTLGTVLPSSRGRRVRTVSRSAEHRVLTVAAGPGSLLVLDEGANAGWRATAGGRSLRDGDGGWVAAGLGAAGRWPGDRPAGLRTRPVAPRRAGGRSPRVAGARGPRAGRTPPGAAARLPVTAAGGWRFEPVALALGLGLVLGGAGGALVALAAVALHVVRRPMGRPRGRRCHCSRPGRSPSAQTRSAGGRAAGALALLAVALSALSRGDPGARTPAGSGGPAAGARRGSMTARRAAGCPRR